MEALGNLIKAITPGVGKVANAVGDVTEKVTDVKMPSYAYGYIPLIIIVIINLIYTIVILLSYDNKKKDKEKNESKLMILVKAWKTILISLLFSIFCGAIVGFFIWKAVWYMMNPHIIGLSLVKQTLS